MNGGAVEQIAVAAPGIDPRRLADPRFRSRPGDRRLQRARGGDLRRRAREPCGGCLARFGATAEPIREEAPSARFLVELGVSAYVCVPLVSHNARSER